ncbi:INSulin related [Caenorhabditis elegans]|uniref:Ceinsulin-1 n=1 Tax=Caenorhabditis elegans TaxID=6239 RepID=G5ECC6_CAEEL|nr:INSulin related [Caenorhabditis elegans]BAA82661.1 Ceinsulin-1 [Caenorhabditis elegans]CAB03444.2 INSulin related [Caenorhabditis elegans]|eukprot:NP_492231.1 INSulin related [Caenorhabditis elegans]
MVHRLFIVLIAIILVAKSTAISLQQADGRMKMCPPGGSTFTMAWSMSCSMRRRKRDVGRYFEKRALIAPSIRQLQTICCQVGCNVEDLLAYCAPI